MNKAKNYSDLMKHPLTNDEIEYINEYGLTSGCYKMIKDRCITNIKLEERPMHCVDPSRNKYILYEKIQSNLWTFFVFFSFSNLIYNHN